MILERTLLHISYMRCSVFHGTTSHCLCSLNVNVAVFSLKKFQTFFCTVTSEKYMIVKVSITLWKKLLFFSRCSWNFNCCWIYLFIIGIDGNSKNHYSQHEDESSRMDGFFLVRWDILSIPSNASERAYYFFIRVF